MEEKNEATILQKAVSDRAPWGDRKSLGKAVIPRLKKTAQNEVEKKRMKSDRYGRQRKCNACTRVLLKEQRPTKLKTVLETLTHGHFKKSVGKWNENIGLSAKCFLKSMHNFLNPMNFP